MTQPALSRQIRALEVDLGVPLLVRDRKGTRLTPAGRQLLDDARPVLAASSTVRHRACAAAQGEIRFTADLRTGGVGTPGQETTGHPLGDDESDNVLRNLLERLDAGDVAQRMEPSLQRIPTYARLAGIDEDGSDRRTAIRRHIGLITHWILNGAPPNAYVMSEFYERARIHAVARESVDGGLQMYRRGARIFWDALLGLATDEERSTLLARSETVWSCLDSYVDTVAGMYVQAFADQSDLPSTGGDRRAHTLFERLCTPLPLTIEDRQRAARLGFDLGGPHRPFVALLRGAPATGRADLASRLRSVGALAFVEDSGVAGLTGPGFDWTPFLDDRRLLLAQDAATERQGIAGATDNLRTLVTLALRSGRRGRVRTEEFLPELLLAHSPDLAGRLARRVFGPLEENESGELAETLSCLASQGFDSSATAAALHVHRNTLLYRVKQIEKLSGLSLQKHRDRQLVWLAVAWIHRVRAPDSPSPGVTSEPG